MKKIEDPYDVLEYISMTEKSVQGIEKTNKIVFIVNIKSTKDEIKKSIKEIFNEELKYVNVLIDQKGNKKAYASFAKPGAAGDVAIKLGII